MQNLPTEDYFYGAGSSAFQALDSNGVPTGPLLFVGNADAVKVSMKVDRKEKRESQSGLNLLTRSKVTQLGGDLAITINETQRHNLEFFLFGDTVVRPLVTAHADENKIPAASVVNQIYRLEYQNLSNVSITDDGAAGATVSTTKYEVDPTYGKIKVLADLGTGPFTVHYDAAAANVVPAFQHSGKSFLYRHEGINTGNDTDEPFLVQFYKVQLDPVSDLDLITDDFGKFEIKGTLLSSPWKPTDPVFGKFGQHVELALNESVAPATLEITTSSVPGGTHLTPYLAVVTARGGNLPYTWDFSVGSLPSGLALGTDGNNAVIYGSAAAAATTAVTIRVTDDDGNTDTQALSIVQA
jgi:hypothetical protein